MPSNLPRPAYDPEIEPFLSMVPLPPTINADIMRELRKAPLLSQAPDLDALLSDKPITHREVSIPGLNSSDSQITLSIFSSTLESGPKPCIYFVHGGGMIIGCRFVGIEDYLQYVEQNDAVVVAVEYRLAPENPDPAPVSDCYAGLLWTAANAAELGIDLERLLICGASAGGGLSAGVALMARDKKGPKLVGQLLCYPMLDDRNDSLSSQQYVDEGVWSRGSNAFGWKQLLGDRAGKEGVSIYAAPARATDLSGLPNTFIDVGSAEVFRDEDIAYASRLWAVGVQAELHVWPGGYHAAENMAPGTDYSKKVKATRLAWMKRVFMKAPKPTTESLPAPTVDEAVGTI